MEALITKTKCRQLRDILRKDILSGQYPRGSKYFSERDLTERFEVSHITVRQALAALVEEGLLTRSQGKGTFVARPRERIQESHLAALFIPAQGHLFGEFARHLIRAVQSAGLHALVYDIYDEESKHNISGRLQQLMASEMAAFIVDGIGDSPYYQLPDCDKKPVIFVYRFETPLPFPNAFKVLHDFEAGGYMAIKHLLDLGHRKILFYSHIIKPEPYFLIHSLRKGMDRAFEENGLDGRNALVIKTVSKDDRVDPTENLAVLKTILSGPRRPTAVFSYGDIRAKDIFVIADKLHLSVPDDLAIIGYYDTPFCDTYPTPLTSISIEPDKIVKEVRKILPRFRCGEKIPAKCIMVPPRLVIRESCGATINKEVPIKIGVRD